MKVQVKKSTRVIHGNKHVQSTLVEAAWGATRKKQGYLKGFYQRLLIKKGSKKALIAVSHKIIKSTYHILQSKEEYKEPLLQLEKRKKQKKKINKKMFKNSLPN
jgi:transposase